MKKVCNTCNTSKSLSEFNKSKPTKDGLSYKCKVCVNEYNNQYREDNKESRKQYNKQYIQTTYE